MRLLILISLFCWAQAAQADPAIAVISHNRSDFGALTRKQVTDIYMGRVTSLPNNSIPLPLDYQGDTPLRDQFYRALTGKSLAQVNAYWARLSFTGQANPPRRLMDKAAVLQVVGKNPDSLGYVENDAVSESVKPLLILE